MWTGEINLNTLRVDTYFFENREKSLIFFKEKKNSGYVQTSPKLCIKCKKCVSQKTLVSWKLHSGSTADRCTELKPVFDPSAGKENQFNVVCLSVIEIQNLLDFREKQGFARKNRTERNALLRGIQRLLFCKKGSKYYLETYKARERLKISG